MNVMRGFIVVLDSFGIGYAPDAEKFGDVGANTIGAVSKSKYLNVRNLTKMGLFSIDGVKRKYSESHTASIARLEEISMGKDTTIGHWEMAGVVSKEPLPTFPNGFPNEVIEKFEKETGRGTLVNKAYSGTKVIEDYGEEHIKTGKLIVYTSADSVFQIAAHEDVVSPEKLYDYCRIARKILKGKYGVGRVIARPFSGKVGSFERTPRRHDFSIEPPKDTMLDVLQKAGKKTITVGKIYDIFAHRGIDEFCYTTSNTDGISKTLDVAKNRNFDGLCYVNLVDFDMKYGHRRDVDGYAKALSEFDECLPEFCESLKDDDFLMITADHGCDPSFKGTDHTREYVPLIIYGKKIKPLNLGTIDGFGVVAKTACSLLGVDTDFNAKDVSTLIRL